MPEQRSAATPDALAEAAARAGAEAGKRGLPPVHLWNPPHCGDIDMRIEADGTWRYMGGPIGRPAMVRLFSTILRRDDDGYVLVTPHEKVGITVEDAPFVAVDMHAGGGRLVFVTNVGDMVAAGPDHPLRVTRDALSGEPRPYVLVRDRLEALIDRKTFYRLVEQGEIREVKGERWFGVPSDGAFFPIQPAAELED